MGGKRQKIQSKIDPQQYIKTYMIQGVFIYDTCISNLYLLTNEIFPKLEVNQSLSLSKHGNCRNPRYLNYTNHPLNKSSDSLELYKTLERNLIPNTHHSKHALEGDPMLTPTSCKSIQGHLPSDCSQGT